MSPGGEVAKSPPVEKQQPKALSVAVPRKPWACRVGPTAEVTATLVLGGAFLLGRDSLTGYITALLVGVARPGGALGFHVPSGRAGALLSQTGEERIWGSLLSLLMLLRKTARVGHPPGLSFGLVLSVCTSRAPCFLRVSVWQGREVPLLYALQSSGVALTPVSVPLSRPTSGC